MPGTFSNSVSGKTAAVSGKGQLSGKSAEIMRMLSDGFSNEAILATDPEITCEDIATAAREALRLSFNARARDVKMAKVIQRYPRAYEKWCPDEEIRVAELYKNGKTIREIAAVVERQPNAIRGRLEKMGLFG